MGILHTSTRLRVLHIHISKVETNMLSATSATTSLNSCLRGYSLKQQQHQRSSSSAESSSSRRSSTSVMMRSSSSEKKSSCTSSSSEDVGRTALLATIASSPIVLSAQDAFAKGGEFGLLEGPPRRWCTRFSWASCTPPAY